MTWYPRLLLVLALACARRNPETAAPPPPPPPAPRPPQTEVPARENATSLEALLAGRISGVVVTPAPGGGIQVRMGGPTSFYGGQEPLFVVDGVPFEGGPNGTLSWLNPRDIESIEALKDPSRTAIYGVRGANGVIIIKTKGAH